MPCHKIQCQTPIHGKRHFSSLFLSYDTAFLKVSSKEKLFNRLSDTSHHFPNFSMSDNSRNGQLSMLFILQVAID